MVMSQCLSSRKFSFSKLFSGFEWNFVLKVKPKKKMSGQFLERVHLLFSRSQWPRGLRRRSAAARLLRSWVRILPGAWIFVCCECRVLSGRGLCDELITRPEESYRLWCVVVCDLEILRMRRPWPALGRSATEKKIIIWILSFAQYVNYWAHLSMLFPHSFTWRQGPILSPKDSVLSFILKAEWWLSPNGADSKLRVRVRQIALNLSNPVWLIK